MKTLLRYPGGKSRAVKFLEECIPEGVEEVCSPFIGGGSFEIHLANKGINIKGYDSFYPLVLFWNKAKNNPKELSDKVRRMYPISREEFKEMQQKIREEQNDLEVAAMFYVLNRSSFSGTTLSGGMSKGHPRFTLSSIERLEKIKYERITVECKSFEESIKENVDMFLYCDPPYVVDSSLYGVKGDKHRGFNHSKLFEILRERDGWVLSYNDCEYIRDLYKGYKIIEAHWTYGMNKNKESSEIIILSEY